jgi:DNA-binding NtrC family response regulator
LPATYKPRVLVVDDEPGVRESLRLILKERAEVTLAVSGEEALAQVAKEHYEVILLDILMPGCDGLEVLERIREISPFAQVIMVTATKTVKTAVRAMKLGAYDYVTKPFDIDELMMIVDRAVETAALRREIEELRSEVGHRYRFDNIIGSGAKMQEVLKTVGIVAALKTTVLLTGESGTGKEVIAKAIHYNSPRVDRPLVTINCAAIPDNLLESELFGHERGAFTDAHTRKLGHFERAHRGTIFLDEIGEMNPATQAKILRVLEESTFTRVGGSEQISVDVRVIAATNRDLDKGMQDGSFRSDLYYRLNVVSIHLPPLRERREDLAHLIRHFLQRKSAELSVPERSFNRDALDILHAYRWPGNVRELENVIERALVLAQTDVLGIEDLPGSLGAPPIIRTEPLPVVETNGHTPPSHKTLSDAVDELEHKLIMDALVRAEYNQSRAAELLGTTRRILKYKMDKLGIQSDDVTMVS